MIACRYGKEDVMAQRIIDQIIEAAADIARHHGRLAVGIEAMALAEFVALDIEAMRKGYRPPPMKPRHTAPHDGLKGPLAWKEPPAGEIGSKP